MVSRGGQRVNELRLSLFISLAEQPDVHWIRFGIHLSHSSHQKAAEGIATVWFKTLREA